MSLDRDVEKSIEWFEETKPLPKSFERRFVVFDNFPDTYENNSDEIAQRIMEFEYSDSNTQHGAVFLGYGYSTAAIENSRGKFALTRQRHYKDTAVFKMSITAPLNIDVENIYYAEGYTEEDLPSEEEQNSTAAGEFMRWLINPNGNDEVSGEVFRRASYPMVKEVSGKLPGRNKKQIRIVLPLVSSQIEDPNWDEVFSELRVDNASLVIEGPTCLFSPKENERVYVIYQHIWDFGIAYIVQAVEQSQIGTPVSVGAYGFLSDDRSNYFEMKSFQKSFVQLSSMTPVGEYRKRDSLLSQNKKCYVESKLDRSEGFLSFLGSHSSTFYEELYSKRANGIPKSAIQKSMCELIPLNDSKQMASLCASLCNTNNLVNISLSDMVTVAIALENKGLFNPTTLTTKSARALSSNKKIIPSMNIKYEQLPSNFGQFVWKNAYVNSHKDDYLILSREKLKALPSDQLISKMLTHFQTATTGFIAEELLFIHGSENGPTASFTAQLFTYLIANERFGVESQTEEVEVLERNSLPSNFPEETHEKPQKDRAPDDVHISTDKQTTIPLNNEDKPRSIASLWSKHDTESGAPLIVVKRTWNRDYCFAVENITHDGTWATGKSFIAGKQYRDSGYSATQELFFPYTGPSKNQILKNYEKLKENSIWTLSY